MQVVFSEYAQQELEDAVHYYEFQREGLGQNFKEEVRKTATRLSDYPRAWPIERDGIRKCLLHQFPYKLLYSIEDGHIVILAVAHQHRKPDYWIERQAKE